MKGIQRIRQLMKKEFVDKMVSLGFEYNLKKSIFYREYNDMWQVVEFYLTYRARWLYAVGYILFEKDKIDEYLEGKVDTIRDYSQKAVSSGPYMKVGSITDDLMNEKSDEEILELIAELYQRIEKKLIPYLNKKLKVEIEHDVCIPDLTEWITSVIIFSYLKQQFKVTPISIKTKDELYEYKFIALYLLWYYSQESKEDIKESFSLNYDEIESIVNNEELYKKNKEIIDAFIADKVKSPLGVYRDKDGHVIPIKNAEVPKYLREVIK